MNNEELTARLDQLEGMVNGLIQQIKNIQAGRVVAPFAGSPVPDQAGGTAPSLSPREADEQPRFIEDRPDVQPLGGGQPSPPQQSTRWTDAMASVGRTLAGTAANVVQGTASGAQGTSTVAQQGVEAITQHLPTPPSMPRPQSRTITPDEARQQIQEPREPMSPAEAQQKMQQEAGTRRAEGSLESQREAGRQWQQYDRQMREVGRTPKEDDQGQTRDDRMASAQGQIKERAQQKQSERHDRMRAQGITPSVDRIKEPYRTPEMGPAPGSDPAKIPPAENIKSQRSGGDERVSYFAEQVASTMFLMNDRLTVAMRRIEELQLALDARGQE